LPGSSPAFVLGVAALAFGGLTAYSRAALSIGAAASSRYVYTIVLLLLPLLALALSQLVGSRTWALRTGVALVLVLAVSQGVVLRHAAGQQAAIEQGSHRVISAALHLYIDSPSSVHMDSLPDPAWAPNIQMRDLVGLYKAHEISVGIYDQNDLRRAEQNVESR
jgi:hypothetical protein